MKTYALVAAFGLAALSAAQKAPNRVDAIMDLANSRMSTQIDAMFDDGDFPASIALLRLQAEMYPADYDVWTNLGWMEENVEAWDSALATYVRFKRQNPKDPDASLPEANFYFNRKLYAKVPPLLETTIKGKCHPNAYRILARSYEKQDMLTDAVRVYKALTVRDPEDGAAKANLKRVEGKLLKGK
jgi:tetratricopeptide (TPR) repeat protein